MAIHWSLPLLEALLPSELGSKLKDAQNDPFWDVTEEDLFKIYNGLDGTVLKALPLPRIVRVSRRKMRALCSQGIDVRYGFEVTDVKYSDDEREVTAVFANGSSVTGSLLIGTDGPRSKVRELLFGPERRTICPVDIVHSDVAITYHDSEKARFVRSAHPSSNFQDAPDEHDPETWCFQIFPSWHGKPDSSLGDFARLAQVKEKALVFAEPFRSAIQWIPDDTKITYNSIGYWVPVPWDNHLGRITLAGNAAHPMPPCQFYLFCLGNGQT